MSFFCCTHQQGWERGAIRHMHATCDQGTPAECAQGLLPAVLLPLPPPSCALLLQQPALWLPAKTSEPISLPHAGPILQRIMQCRPTTAVISPSCKETATLPDVQAAAKIATDLCKPGQLFLPPALGLFPGRLLCLEPLLCLHRRLNLCLQLSICTNTM